MFNFNEVVKIYYFLVYCMIWNEKVQFLLQRNCMIWHLFTVLSQKTLFADTEFGEDIIEQIIRGNITSNFG